MNAAITSSSIQTNFHSRIVLSRDVVRMIDIRRLFVEFTQSHAPHPQPTTIHSQLRIPYPVSQRHTLILENAKMPGRIARACR